MATVIADTGSSAELFILRTFSKVLPGNMARFMNFATWQAAWLRHFFHWERVVVGYALTDVPERVLEVYGIPEPDLSVIARTLTQLHAQEEYQELKGCCVGSREKDEQLLPAMSYKTFLRDFMLRRRKEIERAREEELKLLELKTVAEGALAASERDLATLPTREKLLEQIADLSQRIEVLKGQIAGADATRNDVMAERSLSALNVDQMRRELALLEKKHRLKELELEALPAKREGLQLKIAQASQAVQESARALRDARIQAVSKPKLLDLPIPAYFLNVTIKVKPNRLGGYIKGMQRLLESFKWDFIAAGQHLPEPEGPVDHAQPPRLGNHDVMHLWKFGDANALYLQMVELRENQRFSALAELTNGETQMLMCDWEALSKTKRLSHVSEDEEAVPRL